MERKINFFIKFLVKILTFMSTFIMGKKKTVQSTVKGKAGSKGKTKSKHIDIDRSYLSPHPTTSSVVDTMQSNSMSSPLPQSDVVSLLHRIEQSDKELIQRVKKMEKQNASVTRCISPVTVA